MAELAVIIRNIMTKESTQTYTMMHLAQTEIVTPEHPENESDRITSGLTHYMRK